MAQTIKTFISCPPLPELHYVPFRQSIDWLRWLEQNTYAIAKQDTASQPSQKADRSPDWSLHLQCSATTSPRHLAGAYCLERS
ncbi:hypothetical protein [Scytonema millei]|uniref:hypothetical protein n=1 Tax=Scytonema millei TaxID=1245922 RepID=UPI0010FAA79B